MRRPNQENLTKNIFILHAGGLACGGDLNRQRDSDNNVGYDERVGDNW